MEKYDPGKIESKWQLYWEKHPELFRADDDSKQEKAFILDMFPYPSGEGLHVGHVESYTATDIYSRYLRMKGKNVLHPQGFDAFGLPAENYAIKTGIHPAETTKKAIETFKRQINSMGFSYDWSREVISSDPDYYKWTQWFFLLLYKNGLAYRKKAKVNWCPKCQTVLANEQAETGKCERCETEVIQKDLEQWFFKIMDFIEDDKKTSGLISGLNKVDWPESTKSAQKNWIGRSEGVQFKMQIEGSEENIEVYTTRIDTVFGMTYVVVAPEHNIIQKIKNQIKNWKEIEKYLEESKKKTDLDRMETKEKIGIELKGIKVINPFNNEVVPLFVADYVLGHYGTGAVMAVPAHDERDWEFAKKYKLPIKKVIIPEKLLDIPRNIEDIAAGAKTELRVESECFTCDGELINSRKYSGLTSEEARKKMTVWLKEKKLGQRKINYKLRDWLVSRQRYWGAPIPIIYCEKCAKNKPKFLFLHAYKANSKIDFWPWLKSELENKGFEVFAPDLPGGDEPKVEEQIKFILDNYNIDENIIVVTHSLGGVLAMKLLGSGKMKAKKLIMVAPPLNTDLKDNKPRPALREYCDWNFNFEKIKKNVEKIIVLADLKDYIVPAKHTDKISRELNATLVKAIAPSPHFDCEKSDVILNNVLTSDILNHGEVPVPEKDLPVLLPNDVDFKPTGESPLKYSKKFQNVKCPKCGEKAKRESDTMDTFVCSSWYYLRYADPKNEKEFASKKNLKKWLPVDLYIGGAEHTVLHLLYARFFTKALHKLGYLEFDEPFLKMRHQGIILAEDGTKMSKSKGNVVNPDEVVKLYGADALRMFEMFMGPLEDMKPWQTKGIVGVYRFLERIFKLTNKILEKETENPKCLRNINKTIKKVTEDIENLKFNTAIASMMEYLNYLEKASSEKNSVNKEVLEIFAKLLSPFAPHLAEELWFVLGYTESIFKEKWPEYNPKLVRDEEIELVIQINGKVRDKMRVSAEISESEAKELITKSEKIKSYLTKKEIKKIIFVKGRLVNIVV